MKAKYITDNDGKTYIILEKDYDKFNEIAIAIEINKDNLSTPYCPTTYPSVPYYPNPYYPQIIWNCQTSDVFNTHK